MSRDVQVTRSKVGVLRSAVVVLAVAGIADLLVLNLHALPAMGQGEPPSTSESAEAIAHGDDDGRELLATGAELAGRIQGAPEVGATPAPSRQEDAPPPAPSPAGAEEPLPAEEAEPPSDPPPTMDESEGGPSPALPELPDLRFATGSAELGGPARQVLWEVARVVAQQPQVSVLLRGHSDERGEDASNEELSAARARAAASFLEGRGIPPDRIRTEGVGERQPADRGSTAQALARNRRVEVVWQ